jgi:TRAP transporter TAXI family solute receptor
VVIRRSSGGQFQLGTAEIVGNDASSELIHGPSDMVRVKKAAHTRRKEMLSKAKLYSLAASTAAIALVLAAAIPQRADAQERKSIRWTTSAVGSYGYTIAAQMAKILEQTLGGEYTVTVQPYTSPTVAMKAVMNGEGEIAYTADVGMTQFHERSGGFKDYKPTKPELAHSWYAYPMESMMATSAKDADKYKCWKDFSGKPVFFTTAGFMNWLNMQRSFKALGYQFKHVQIDIKSNSDALKAGTIVGSTTYTTAGKSLAPYWKETEIRMDIAVVNPCPDEVAKLRAAGLAVVDVDPKGAFTKDVGPKMLQGVPILFGYNARLDMPEAIVYKMVKAFYDKKDELVKLDAGFTPMAKDFIGMQVQGINANPQVPVHPGLAKFLKEHKAWNDKWKIGGSSS